ncbi:MAG: hypothetical protein DIU65_01800 [Proteobacteria bacterium]|nr:MAG: hypothetical protein DIU65_01800 [Pseudomonadota bacterium]
MFILSSLAAMLTATDGLPNNRRSNAKGGSLLAGRAIGSRKPSPAALGDGRRQGLPKSLQR